MWGLTASPWRAAARITAAFLEAGADAHPQRHGVEHGVRPGAPAGTIGTVTHEQLWSRPEFFLREILPVAEEAGVVMAAHPDDPPMPEIRGTARLVHQPRIYQDLFDRVPARTARPSCASAR